MIKQNMNLANYLILHLVLLISSIIFERAFATDACEIRTVNAQSGCECDLNQYYKELDVARNVITQTNSGLSSFAQSAIASWGINPCQVGPTIETTRYYFGNLIDYPMMAFRSEMSKPCREICDQKPWKVHAQSILACREPSSVSYCNIKKDLRFSDERYQVSHCQSYGININDCESDPLCEVKRKDLTQNECLQDDSNLWVEIDGNENCLLNTCRLIHLRDQQCLNGASKSCLVNCNDCQDLTFHSLSSLNFKCFDIEKVESYSIRGNAAVNHIAGTHSMVKLVPKDGSIAELMAPMGHLVDAWNGSHVRKITKCEVNDPEDVLNDHYVNLNLSPILEKDDVPLELLAFYVGVTREVMSSNNCPITNLLDINLVDHFIKGSLLPFYIKSQKDYCHRNNRSSFDVIKQSALNSSILSSEISSVESQ